MDPLEQKIKEVFEQIPFGENGSNILEKNVVYSTDIENKKATVVLVITEEYKDLEGDIARKVKEGLKSIDGIDQVAIDIVRSTEEIGAGEQPAHPNPAPPEQANYLENYEHVVLVASGKGGVGKSTVAINLALSLKAIGKRVSLMDADVYGPSIPIMLGVRNEALKLTGSQIKPINKFGIDFISVGNMVKEDQALIWRGPMTHQVIQQILRDSAWPGGDYMIIDLPPGTGDVQLSISQLTSATGAVIVCTPQDVALLDARKAVGMFDKVNIPVLGIIENMSYFVCPKCGAETPIFSKGGAERESKAQNVPFIGRVPIEIDIRLGSDNGEPIVHSMPDSSSAKHFIEMAKTLDKIVQEG
ncbi:Mrp/NBP35 family ATP-binding protein [bacterium]|nr:Mrp/NBP35 family ATP-binding protein [bacterium]